MEKIVRTLVAWLSRQGRNRPTLECPECHRRVRDTFVGAGEVGLTCGHEITDTNDVTALQDPLNVGRDWDKEQSDIHQRREARVAGLLRFASWFCPCVNCRNVLKERRPWMKPSDPSGQAD